MGKKNRVGLAFRLDGEHDVPLASGGWRVWTHGEDTYITAKSLRDTWKVALHGDAYWYSGVTADNAARPDTVLPAGHDRAWHRFEPTPFVDGRRDAFAVAVARGALLPHQSGADDVVVHVPDRWDVLTVAMVRMTEPGVEPQSWWDVIAGPLPLRSGRRVWVTQQFDQFESGEPQPDSTGALIKPMTPGVQDVRCPGWMVVGLRVV